MNPRLLKRQQVGPTAAIGIRTVTVSAEAASVAVGFASSKDRVVGVVDDHELVAPHHDKKVVCRVEQGTSLQVLQDLVFRVITCAVVVGRNDG